MKNIHFVSGGDGRPVVFLHGFCETHKIWGDFMSLLCPHTKSFALDLPGFGRSPLSSRSFSLDEIAHELNCWIESENLPKPILIGHSLGGYISLAMVALKPSLFSGMVLFHSTAMPDGEEKQRSRLKAVEFVKKKGVAPFIQNFIPELFHNQQHPAIPSAIQLASATTVGTFISYTLAMKDRPDRQQVLKSSRCPMLLISGEYDPVIEPQSLRSQASLNSSIRFSNLLNTGHMGFLESPKESAKAINDLILSV